MGPFFKWPLFLVTSCLVDYAMYSWFS